MACALILADVSFANPYDNYDRNGINPLQDSGRPVTFTGTKIFGSSICRLATLDSTPFRSVSIPDTKNININALTDFQVRFKEATRVMWYSDGNSFTSYFTKDGFTDRVCYNKNGSWQYSLIYYNQDKLPRNVSKIIKSNYADLDIDIVVETQTIYGIAYVVYLGNQSNIRILKVNADGEIETMMELPRG